MFYSRDILCMRGGKFAIVWAEATSFKKLTRRDYMLVNVHRTCEDIIDYILLRIEPRRSGGQRPRLSLYLSSQLMYGVVKVYNKQIDFLLNDIAAFSSRFRLAATVGDFDINMKSTGRERDQVTMGDILTRAEDPLYDLNFGRLMSDLDFPTFADIPALEMWKTPARRASVSSHSSHTSSHTSPGPISPKHLPQIPDIASPFTVTNAEITLKEVDMPDMPQDLLAAEGDFGHLEGQQLDDLLLEMQLASPQIQELPTTPEQAPIAAILSTPTKYEMTTAVDTSSSDPAGTVARPRKSQIPSSPGVTPVSKPPAQRERRSKRKLPVITMDLSPITPRSPLRVRRRRRLLFADATMQISREEMKANMRTATNDLCHPLKLPRLEPTLHELLTKGCHKGTKHHLIARNMTSACEGLKTYESDEGRPFWYAPGFTSSESISSDELRGLGTELPLHFDKDALTVLESSLSPVFADQKSPEAARDETGELVRASLSLDESQQQQSLVSLQNSSRSLILADTAAPPPSKKPRVSITSSDDEALIVAQTSLTDKAGDELPTVPEEIEPIQLAEPSPNDSLSKPFAATTSAITYDLLTKVSHLTAESYWTRFHDICPPGSTSRPAATTTFAAMLEQVAEGRLIVHQRQAFSNIYVSRGRLW